MIEATKRIKINVASQIDAEKDLRFQANILAQASDAIIAADMSKIIRYWNPAAERLYGLMSHQVLGKPIDEVFRTGLSEMEQGAVGQSLLRDGYWHGEARTVVLETNKEVHTSTQIKLTSGKDNEPKTIIISSRDIREQVKTQKALTYKTNFQQLITELAIQLGGLVEENLAQGIHESLAVLTNFLNVDGALIGLVNEREQTVSTGYAFNNENVCIPKTFSQNDFPLQDHPWLFEPLSRSEVVQINDVSQLPTHQQNIIDFLQLHNFKSMVFAPLKRQDLLIGFLTCYTVHRAVNWLDGIADQLLVLGQIIFNAIEKRHYEKSLKSQAVALDELASQRAAINSLNQAIFSSRSLPEIAQAAQANLPSLVKCEYSCILLLSEENSKTLCPLYQTHVDVGLIQLAQFGLTSYMPQIKNGEIVIADDSGKYAPDSSESTIAAKYGLQSSAYIPLWVRSSLIGIVHLGFSERETGEKINVETLESIASSLSLAIANAQLYDQVQLHTTELEQKVFQRTAELERQNSLQAALAKIELSINSPTELQQALNQIVEVTADTLPADIGAGLVLLEPEESIYYMYASSASILQEHQIKDLIQTGSVVMDWILESGNPLMVSDVRSDPFATFSMLEECGIGSYVGLPLAVEGDVIGILYTFLSQTKVFSEEEIDFLMAVASRAAVAVTKVSLLEQVKTIATENERRRIAHELHDGVTQSLFSASVIAESLPRLIKNRPEIVRSSLQDLHQLTSGTLAEMRTLLFELLPNSLTEADLAELLHQLADAFTRRTQVSVALTAAKNIDLPPSQHVGIYRIAQEALNNIAHHAHATQVSLTLSDSPHEYSLCISDNGIGFEPQKIPPGHLGVQIMHERAVEINANLEISSTIGNGTKVELTRRYSG